MAESPQWFTVESGLLMEKGTTSQFLKLKGPVVKGLGSELEDLIDPAYDGLLYANDKMRPLNSSRYSLHGINAQVGKPIVVTIVRPM